MNPSPPRVLLSDLILAFDFTSADAPVDHYAVIDPDSGAIHLWSEETTEDEGLPADIETSDRYLRVPDRRELDLGRDLALDFAAERLPGDYQTVVDFFRKRGAYGRFKDLLDSRGLLDQWHAFEERETESALREWCRENGIEVVEDPPTS